MRKAISLILMSACIFAACNKQASPVKVTSVSLSQSQLDMYVDSTFTLTATVLPENADNKAVAWISSNPEVVSVDNNGVLKGIADGAATVTVATADGGFTSSCDVNVTTLVVPVTGIAFDPSEVTVRIGKTLATNIKFTPANATDKSITYSIPARFQKFASIDESGVLTGIAEGQFTLTATSANGKTAKATVKVSYENLPWVDGYPVGVSVHKFTDDLGDGMTCEGAWAEIDFSKNVCLRFNTLHGSKKTIVGVDEDDKVDWYDLFPEEKGMPIILTNAGFFDATWGTSSAVVSEGAFQAAGATSTGISGYSGSYYPVRSALCQKKDGSFSCEWIYCVNDKTVYTYPSALGQNDQTGTFFPTKECPTQRPQANTPGAQKWEDGLNMMQGGPRLVQNGKNVAWDNTWAELLNGTVTSASSGDSYRTSRTAAGVTAEGHLILLVCRGDGRKGKSPEGFNMSELADKMIEVGCVDAVNFDGGGSSQMIGPDGKSIVPAWGSLRAMPTILAVSEMQYE